MDNSIRMLRLNGNMKESPLVQVIRKIDLLCNRASIAYAVIGGMAVVRNGAFRTTMDVDILLNKHDKGNIDTAIQKHSMTFEIGADCLLDTEYGIEVDILYSGDEWEMIIPLPKPDKIREYDSEYGAWFINFYNLLELKTAIYLKKKEEDGIEIAAKDLADITSLLQKNKDFVNLDRIQCLAPGIQETLLSIVRNVL